jgi:hypothetical protein
MEAYPPQNIAMVQRNAPGRLRRWWQTHGVMRFWPLAAISTTALNTHFQG